MKRKSIVAIVGVLALLFILATPFGQALAQSGYTYFANVYVEHNAMVDGGARISQPTVVATATPLLHIVNYAGSDSILAVNASGTPTWQLYATGAQKSGGALDMNTNIISNIGNAGTDFQSNGGLVTANGITATTGGVTANAGGLTATAGGLTVTAGDANLGAGLNVDGSVVITGTSYMKNNIVDDGSLIVYGDVQAISSITVTNNAVVSGTLKSVGTATMSGVASIGTFARLVPATAITITDNGVLTPTGTYQRVQEAGAVTVTLATAGRTAGDLLIVENLSAQTVVITDTAYYAAPSLGQYDTAQFIYDGTEWVQIGASNN